MSPNADAALRIASLLPAATEIVYGLGLGGSLVGVSHECDHPPAATRLPRLTRPAIDPDAPSRELDADVKRRKASGQGIVEIDAAALRRLRPSVLLTQTLCDVCAITPQDVARAVEGLDPAPQVVTLDAQSLEGVLADVRKLGEAFDRREEAKLLIFRQWRTTKEIRSRVQDLEPTNVAILDWVDPIMFAGHWMPELAAIAGGRYTLVDRGSPSRWGSLEELEESEPDVVVAAPCGRTIAQTRDELTALFAGARPGDLTAKDSRRVFVADGRHYFNRAGPRLIYSAALLARAFHPEAVPPLPAELQSHLVPWISG